MNRKKFFTSISLGVIGFTLLNTFPFNVLAKKSVNNKKQVRVKINPLAVSRKKIGDKNVG